MAEETQGLGTIEQPDKLQGFYNSLLGTGKVTPTEIGDFDTFYNGMRDKGKRESLYQNLVKQAGISPEFLGGDFDTYSGRFDDYYEGERVSKKQQMQPEVESRLKEIDQHLKNYDILYKPVQLRAKQNIGQSGKYSGKKATTVGVGGRPVFVENKDGEDIYTPIGEDAPRSYATGEDLQKIQNLEREKEYLTKAKRLLNVDKGDNMVKLAWEGLTNPLIQDQISLGFNEMQRLMVTSGVAQKAQKGEKLRDDEQKLLNAYLALEEAQNIGDNPSSFRYMNILSEMMPYMAQFALTEGIGTGASAAAKQGLKSFAGKYLAEKVGEGTAKALTKKAITGTVGLTADAIVRAPMLSSAYTDYFERRAGEFERNKQGDAQYVQGSAQGKAEAGFKAYAGAFADAFGEGTGDALALGLGTPMKWLGKKIAPKLFSETISPTGLNRVINQFRKASKFSDPLYEIGEEYVTAVVKGITTGEWEDWNYQTTAQGFMDVAVPSFLMAGAFKAAELPGRGYYKYSTNRAYNKSSRWLDRFAVSEPEIVNDLLAISNDLSNIQSWGDRLSSLFDKYPYITTRGRERAMTYLGRTLQKAQMEGLISNQDQNASINILSKAEQQTMQLRHQDGNVYRALDEDGNVMYVVDGDMQQPPSAENPYVYIDQSGKKQIAGSNRIISIDGFSAQEYVDLLRNDMQLAYDSTVQAEEQAQTQQATMEDAAKVLSSLKQGSRVTIDGKSGEVSDLSKPDQGIKVSFDDGGVDLITPERYQDIAPEETNQEAVSATNTASATTPQEQQAQPETATPKRQFQIGKAKFEAKDTQQEGVYNVGDPITSAKKAESLKNGFQDSYGTKFDFSVQILPSNDDFEPDTYQVVATKKTKPQDTNAGQPTTIASGVAEQASNVPDTGTADSPSQDVRGYTEPTQGSGGTEEGNQGAEAPQARQDSQTEKPEPQNVGADRESGVIDLTPKPKRSRQLSPDSRTYKALDREPQSAEESLLQYFIGGGSYKSELYMKHTGFQPNSREVRTLRFSGLITQNGKTEEQISGNIELFGLGEQGAMDLTNLIVETLNSYPSKGAMLSRIEFLQGTYANSEAEQSQRENNFGYTDQEISEREAIEMQRIADEEAEYNEILFNEYATVGIIDDNIVNFIASLTTEEYEELKGIDGELERQARYYAEGRANNEDSPEARTEQTGVSPQDGGLYQPESPKPPTQPIDLVSNIEIKAEESKVNTDPTDAQKEAGNYKMGHVKVQGFDITIENPKGSVRSGTDQDGEHWEITMNNTYGYFKRTEAIDGDNVDVFIGDNPESGKIFVVDQIDPKTKKFDEHKVMLGFNSIEEAQKAYLSNYSEGWQGLGAITEISYDDFKNFLTDEERSKQPVAYKQEEKQPEPIEPKDFINKIESEPSPKEKAANESQGRKERMDAINTELTKLKSSLGKKEREASTIDAAIKKAASDNQVNLNGATNRELEGKLDFGDSRQIESEATKRLRKVETDIKGIKASIEKLQAEYDSLNIDGKNPQASIDFGEEEQTPSQQSPVEPTSEVTGQRGEKQPWEMTREEYEKDVRKIDDNASVVEKALGQKFFPEQIKATNLRKKADLITKNAQSALGGMEAGQPVVSIADRNKREAASDKMFQAGQLYKQADELDGIWKNRLYNNHLNSIQQALSEGKPVPEEVLAEYPELRKEERKPKIGDYVSYRKSTKDEKSGFVESIFNDGKIALVRQDNGELIQLSLNELSISKQPDIQPVLDNAKNTQPTTLQDVAAKYGWTATQTGDKTELKNKKGVVAAIVTTKGGKYTITDSTGTKLLSGNNGVENGVEKVIKEYFYGQEVEQNKRREIDKPIGVDDNTPNRTPVIGIGDLHGENPEQLKTDLIKAGIINKVGDWITDKTIVQVGDVTDRGQYSEQLIDLLSELQKKSNGKFVRILGNHDLAHLMRKAESIGGVSNEMITAKLREGVLDGSIVAAWSEGDTIYTHAGINLDTFDSFVGVSIDAIVKNLNERLVYAVKRNSFSDAIFKNEGIFWTRGDIENNQFRQVVGHTVKSKQHTYKNGDRVKYIDTGRVFGGSRDLMQNTVANNSPESLLNPIENIPEPTNIDKLKDVLGMEEKTTSQNKNIPILKGSVVDFGETVPANMLEKAKTIDPTAYEFDGKIVFGDNRFAQKFTDSITDKDPQLPQQEPVQEQLELEIETDQAEIQKLRNSLAEGELILRTGKINGRKMSSDELTAVKKSVDKTKKRLGEKIEDYGEKIEGARKDAIKKYFDKINLNGRILSVIFPKPDYKALLESGMSVKDVAGIKVAYEFAVDDKKRGENVIKFYAAYAKSILAESINLEFKNNNYVFTDYGKSQITLRTEAYKAVAEKLGNEYLSLDLTKVRIKEMEAKDIERLVNKENSGKYRVQYYVNAAKYFNSIEDAINEFVEQVQKNTTTDTVVYKHKIGIYHSRYSGKDNYIGYQPKGKDFIKLKDGFANANDAFAYKKEHEAELQVELQRILDEQKQDTKRQSIRLKYTNETSRDRVGKDWRNGRDISSKEFAETFGFRGVEFGNWVNQAERQVFMNNSFDSLMDLAQMLNIPPKAISLSGELGITFGSRGSGQAAAHYEPGRRIINLTKTQGLGSLAHEWFHGVDNYFAGFKSSLSGMEAATNQQYKDDVRPEIKKAFDTIYNVLGSGGFKKRSRNLDSKLSKNYFSLPHEMAARAFENYVLSRLNESGQINDFIVNYTSDKDWNGDVEMYPYPKAGESEAINEAFQKFFDTVETKVDDQGNTPMFSRQVSEIGFYSTVEDALDSITQPKGTPEQFKAMLLKNGAKQTELDWMGWDDFAQGKNAITKADIQNWIDQNRIEIKEVVKGDKESDATLEINQNAKGEYYVYNVARGKRVSQYYTRWQDAADYLNENKSKPENTTKYSQYVEPGGSNYKELLLTMPVEPSFQKNAAKQYFDQVKKVNEYKKSTFPREKGEDIVDYTNRVRESLSKDEIYQALTKEEDRLGDIYNSISNKSGEKFKSSHFEEPNIVAHVRMNDRFIGGQKVLFVEEIQSDFSQAVRAGKTTAQTPFAKTDQWVNLALRRIMRYAVENGYDRIAWTNGEQQAGRYDLSKQINTVSYLEKKDQFGNKTYTVDVLDKQNNAVMRENSMTLNQIEDSLGKEIAKKISNGEGNAPLPGKNLPTYLTGLDLKVGGEGMKAFYDQIIPAQANKVGKPFGAKVESVVLPEVGSIQSIPVTDKMRTESPKGLPMFQIIGETGAANLDKAEEATTRMDNLRVAREMEKGETKLSNKAVSDIFTQFAKQERNALENVLFNWNDIELVVDEWNGEISDIKLKGNAGRDASFSTGDNSAPYKASKKEFINWLTSDKPFSSEYAVDEDWTNNINNLRAIVEKNATRKPLDPKTIRLATGWERGKDGLWRYEVSDERFTNEFKNELSRSSERYNDERTQEGYAGITDIYGKESEMLKAYPKLKKLSIRINIHPDNSNTGYFKKGEKGDKYTFGTTDEIEVKANSIEQAESVLIHEIQHAIQEVEGFAKGGNNKDIVPTQFKSDSYIKSLEQGINFYFTTKEGKEVDAIIDEFIKANPDFTDEQSDKLDNELSAKYPEYERVLTALKEIKRQRSLPDNNFEAYKRLAGEVEARNAQTRMGFTPEQRQNTLLAETEDVAREDQIVLQEGLRQADSVMFDQPGLMPSVPTMNEIDNAMLSTVESTQKAVDMIAAMSSNPVPVKICSTYQEVMGEMTNDGSTMDEIRYASDNMGMFSAIYVPSTGKVFMIHKFVKRFGDLARIWVHEVGVHSGMRRMLPYLEQDLLMRKVYDSISKKEMTKFITQYTGYDNLPQAMQAEEYLAKMSMVMTERGAFDPYNTYTLDQMRALTLQKTPYTKEQLERIITTFVFKIYNDGQGARPVNNNTSNRPQDRDEAISAAIRARIFGISSLSQNNAATRGYKSNSSQTATIRPIYDLMGKIETKKVINELYETETEPTGLIQPTARETDGRYSRRATRGIQSIEDIKPFEEWEKSQFPEYEKAINDLLNRVYNKKEYPTPEELSDAYFMFRQFKKHNYLSGGFDQNSLKALTSLLVKRGIMKYTVGIMNNAAIDGYDEIFANGFSVAENNPEYIPETITVDGKERPTRNSKGQYIHPILEGIQNFWRWFGESKVVDEQGRPLVVYHGTTSKEEIEIKDRSFRYNGFYSTAFPLYASKFADTQGSVMPLFVNIKNPYIIEMENNNFGVRGGFVIDDRLFPTYRDLSKDDILFLKAKGFDGILVNVPSEILKTKFGEGVLNNFEVVSFSPTQIKSATGNDGTFNPSNPSILMSALPSQQPETLSTGDKLRELAQDKDISILRLTQAIKERGGKTPWWADPYNENNKLSSKSNYDASTTFERKLFRPLLQSIAAIVKTGKTQQQVETYMKAKHSLERHNSGTKAIGKDGTDWDLKTVTNIIKTFEQDVPKALVDDLWDKTSKATWYSIKKLYESGIMPPKVYEELEKKHNGEWAHYVPLRAWKFEEGQDPNDLFNYLSDETTFVSATTKAKGRQSQAEDPLAYIQSMAMSAIAQGNKNKVKLALFDLVRQNLTMKDLFRVEKVYLIKDAAGNWNEYPYSDDTTKDLLEKRKKIEEQIEQYKAAKKAEKDPANKQTIQDEIDFLESQIEIKTSIDRSGRLRKTGEQQGEHLVYVYDNGVKYSIWLSNPEVARAINNKSWDDNTQAVMQWFQQYPGSVNRWLTQNFTGKNPAFIPVNWIRDVGYASVSHMVRQDGELRYFVKNMPKAFSAIHRHLKEVQSIADAQDVALFMQGGRIDFNGFVQHFGEKKAYDTLYDLFRREGGETGYIHLEELKQLQTNINKEVKREAGTNTITDKAWRKVGVDYLGYALDYMATESENSTRFATFLAALEAGKTVAEAATEAKNISVNFNRKGRVTGFTNSLFAFSNVALQGGQNLFSMAKNNPKRFAIAAGAFAAAGFVLSEMLMAAGGDDDEYKKLPDYVRHNNIVLPNFVGKGYVTIPLPPGFRNIWAIGVIGSDMLHGQKTASEGAFRAITNLPEAFSPFSLGESEYKQGKFPFRLLTPTVLTPVRDIIVNEDFTGKRVYKEPFTQEAKKYTPQYQLAGYKTNPFLVRMSKFLNKAAGGDENRPASIGFDKETGRVYEKEGLSRFVANMADFNPSKVEHLFEYYIGGRGKFWNQLYKTGEASINPENDVKAYNMPIINRLYTQPYSVGNFEKYSEVRNDVEIFKYYYSRVMNSENPDPQEIMSINSNKEMMELVPLFDMYDGLIKAYSEQIEMEQSPDMRKQLKERRDEIMAELTKQADNINKKYNK